MKAIANEQMSLKILTYNAGLFELKLFGFSIIKPADFLTERLAVLPDAIIKLDPDIIGLQEVYLKKHQDSLIEKLKNVYPFNCYKRNKTIKIDNGLMIFSKFPISENKYYPLNDKGPLVERTFVKKGILTCTVDVPEYGKLDFINFHTTSGGFLYKQDSTEIINIRNNQINQANNIAEKIPYPVIILGDFNTGPEIAGENYELLIKKGYTDSYLQYCNIKRIKPKITWDNQISLNKNGIHSTSISQRIDHIFLHPKLKDEITIKNAKVVFDLPVVEIKSTNTKVHVSDHYGLFVELVKNNELLHRHPI